MALLIDYYRRIPERKDDEEPEWVPIYTVKDEKLIEADRIKQLYREAL